MKGNRVFIQDVNENLIKEIVKDFEFKCTHTGSSKYPMLNCALIPCGFDIESFNEFMYIWTLTLCSTTIIGYTWDEFLKLLDIISNALNLGVERKIVKHRDGTEEEKRKAPKVLVVLIHNIKYEWCFLKSKLNVSDAFFKDARERDPMFVIHNEKVLFIDSYKIYPMKLEEVAKCYCTTRKTHDLDYDVPRNIYSAKKLTEEELTYCCNDTLILSELATHTFNTFFKPYGRLPMTQNQIIRTVVNYNFSNCSTLTKDDLKNYYISQKQYNLIRKLGFRGGWCQSSESWYDGEIGYGDLTSAYCAAICHGYYPMGKYHRETKKVTWSNISWWTKQYCCHMRIKFFDLKVKGYKHIFYESKGNITPYMPDGSAPVTEEDKRIMRKSIRCNGSQRLIAAKCFTVTLSEIGLENYEKVYDWDKEKSEILILEYAKRGQLSDYIIKTAIDFYEAKAKLKKAGKTDEADYFTAKTLVSNIFGAMVKKLPDDLVTGSEKDWMSKTLNSTLRPQWGCYVTDHVRNWLVNVAIEMGCKHWLYSDTDSVYYVLTPESKQILDRFNEKMRENNKLFCEKYGLDFSLFDDLGCFDDESKKHLKITKFKTLSAKAYMYYYTNDKFPDGNIKLVLAGIPEKFFWDAYFKKYPEALPKEEEIDRIFDFFDKKTEITYMKKELVEVKDTDAIINGIHVHCDTGCYIQETPIRGQLFEVAEILAYDELKAEIERRMS